MMNTPEIHPETNNAWLSEVFRLTSFFRNSDRLDTSKWWETVVGELPDNRNAQPKIGVFQDQGPYESGQLIMSAQPGRVDWLFIPSFDKQIGMPNLLELPPYHSKKELFLQIVDRWFEICPPTIRVAYGLVLNKPVSDKKSGYRELSKYLSTIQMDPENSSDFLYQINRRRLSKNIPGLQLNRLSKWTVASAEITQIPIGAVIIPTADSNQQTNIRFARLELDINTAQEFTKTIPNENISSIFIELAELADEIAELGDIK